LTNQLNFSFDEAIIMNETSLIIKDEWENTRLFVEVVTRKREE